MLPSIGVSRRHVQVQVSEEAIEVHDLGSIAGTFVNELQVVVATIIELSVQIMLEHLSLSIYSRKRPLQTAVQGVVRSPT